MRSLEQKKSAHQFALILFEFYQITNGLVYRRAVVLE